MLKREKIATKRNNSWALFHSLVRRLLRCGRRAFWYDVATTEGKWVFMNGRVKDVLRRCLGRIFCEWEGRATQGWNAGVTFYEWEDSEFHCASVILRFLWMEELEGDGAVGGGGGGVSSQGQCQAGLHEWVWVPWMSASRHSVLFMYAFTHSCFLWGQHKDSKSQEKD